MLSIRSIRIDDMFKSDTYSEITLVLEDRDTLYEGKPLCVGFVRAGGPDSFYGGDDSFDAVGIVGLNESNKLFNITITLWVDMR